MLRDTEINALWDEFRTAIDKAYDNRNIDNNDPRHELRDYSTNASWSDDLQQVLAIEVSEERKHRKARPYEPKNRWYCNATSSAKLLLMRGAADGAELETMPSSVRWLRIRRTIAEMELLGWIAREGITEEWKKNVRAIDYTKLHN